MLKIAYNLLSSATRSSYSNSRYQKLLNILAKQSRPGFKMADDSTVREPLTVETTTCRPSCKRPVNGTAVKFTFFAMTFQIILIVLFMALVDYGGQSMPPRAAESNSSETAEKNSQKVNDITIYYSSKC